MGINKAIDGLPTISASRVKVYKTCARQYEYKYVITKEDRPEDRKNVAALLGTALHKAIELKYTEGKSPTAVFQQVMTETLDGWEDEGLQINALDYFSRALKIGKDILQKYPWDRFTPMELEYTFTLPFPSFDNAIVNVTGIIDQIDMDGSIIDHKSASYAPSQDVLDNDPQFILYYWAYTQIYGYPPYRVIWNHLRTDRQIIANIEHNYALKIDQLTYDIQAMLENTRYPRRAMDDVCKKQCSFYSLCYGDRPLQLAKAEETEE